VTGYRRAFAARAKEQGRDFIWLGTNYPYNYYWGRDRVVNFRYNCHIEDVMLSFATRTNALVCHPGQRGGTRLYLARYKITPITIIEDVIPYIISHYYLLFQDVTGYMRAFASRATEQGRDSVRPGTQFPL